MIGSGGNVNSMNGSESSVERSVNISFQQQNSLSNNSTDEEVQFLKEEEDVLVERLHQLRQRRYELQGSSSSSSSSSDSSSGSSFRSRGRAFGLGRCRDRPNRSPSGPRGSKHHKRRHFFDED